MLLTAYVLNGTPVNELSSFLRSDLAGNDPFKWEASVSAGFQDITSVENIDSFGLSTAKDYKWVRSELKALVVSIVWANLTDAEKKVASRWYVVGRSKRDEVHTTEEQIANGLVFHSQSMGTRGQRRLHAVAELYGRLSKTEMEEVVDDLQSGALARKYVRNGREGTDEGDAEGLFDWVEARTGTAFSSSGLAAKGWTPIGKTLTQLKDKIMDILKEGNYP